MSCRADCPGRQTVWAGQPRRASRPRPAHVPPVVSTDAHRLPGSVHIVLLETESAAAPGQGSESWESLDGPREPSVITGSLKVEEGAGGHVTIEQCQGDSEGLALEREEGPQPRNAAAFREEVRKAVSPRASRGNQTFRSLEFSPERPAWNF